MQEQFIAPHESIEVHELLTFKNLCAMKTSSLAGLIQDEELKSILLSDVNQTKQQIVDLKNLLTMSNMDRLNNVTYIDDKNQNANRR